MENSYNCIYLQKGYRADLNNYRAITLLRAIYNIRTIILAKRITPIMNPQLATFNLLTKNLELLTTSYNSYNEIHTEKNGLILSDLAESVGNQTDETMGYSITKRTPCKPYLSN